MTPLAWVGRPGSDVIFEVVRGLESRLGEPVLPGPCIDYAWQLDFLADKLVDWVYSRDEAAALEEKCEEHPWLTDMVETVKIRQVERIQHIRGLSEQAKEAGNEQEVKDLVKEARRCVEIVAILQRKKEDHLRRSGIDDLGGSD